jgi:hypothetical protein
MNQNTELRGSVQCSARKGKAEGISGGGLPGGGKNLNTPGSLIYGRRNYLARCLQIESMRDRSL